MNDTEFLEDVAEDLMRELRRVREGPKREEKYEEETDRIGFLLHHRGDLRIGQLLVNIARNEVNFPFNADNPHEALAQRVETFLFNVEDDKLAELLEDEIDKMHAAETWEED